MGYAVELYFDEPSEHSLRPVYDALAGRGIPNLLDSPGFRPHVSLVVVDKVDADRLVEVVADYAPTIQPFSLTLTSVGAFPTAEGVVYLSPTPTEILLAHHRAFHSRLQAAAITSVAYYLPDRWMPHCTVGIDLNCQQVLQALETCLTTFQGLTVQVQEIGVISFRPVQPLGSFALGTTTNR